MRTLQENVQRGKRFRELKATLRTDRSRLLVGLDIAQAEHVAQLRHAHTRIVVPTLTIPNTTRGFATLWARIAQAQRATGCREVVCGLEPTGTVPRGRGHVPGSPGGGCAPALQRPRPLEPPDPGRDLGQARSEGCGALRRSPGAGQGPLLPSARWPPRGAAAPGEVPALGPGRARRRQGALADEPPARPRPDGGAAPASPPGGAPRGPAGLGAGGPGAAGGGEGPAPARAGHGLRRSRRAGRGRAGAPHGA